MPVSTDQYLAMLARLEGSKSRNPQMPSDAVDEEIPLHGKIMQWCKDNRAPDVHARSDRPSAVTVGATDFVIGFKGKVFWIEVKDRDGKRKTPQLAFSMLLEMQGLKADLCRSFSEFLSIINQTNT